MFSNIGGDISWRHEATVKSFPSIIAQLYLILYGPNDPITYEIMIEWARSSGWDLGSQMRPKSELLQWRRQYHIRKGMLAM
jgi:hypothetical protein